MLNSPRQRTHTPDGVRVSVHQGAAPFLGMTGYTSHCEVLKQFSGRTKSQLSMAIPSLSYTMRQPGSFGLFWWGILRRQEIPVCHAATALRTAATSAVGTRALAKKNARILGIFGGGNQARAHLVALSTIYNFQKIKVYTRSAENRETFARE